MQGPLDDKEYPGSHGKPRQAGKPALEPNCFERAMFFLALEGLESNEAEDLEG